jgi:hypothetical protein
VAGAGLAALAVAGCGGTRQDANEAAGKYPVSILRATFPAKQRLSQRTKMRIRVRNVGTKTIPAIAVSLLDPDAHTAAQAFSDTSSDAQLSNRSRPIWIVDKGPFDGDTAYSNTWQLGALKPRKSKTFTWSVTSARAGDFRILYRVSAGLDGKAKAVSPGTGRPVTGEFDTHITSKPLQATVDPAGNVITSGG